MLKVCHECEQIDDVVEMLFSMNKKFGIKSYEHHYNCLLDACSDIALLSSGRKAHNHIIRSNFLQDIIIAINVYYDYLLSNSLLTD